MSEVSLYCNPTMYPCSSTKPTVAQYRLLAEPLERTVIQYHPLCLVCNPSVHILLPVFKDWD